MRKRRKINSKFLMSVSGVVLLILMIISSPIFSIQEIEITGNHTLTEHEILETMSIRPNDNIFYVNLIGAKNRLLKNPYVGNVSIQRHMPNRMSISIEERRARGYVEFGKLDVFLLIDEFGRVLEVTTNTPTQLPVIVGLRFDGFTIGEVLNVNNNAEFETMVLLSQMFTKYGISDIVKLDVSDSSDITLYVNDISFQFGTIEDADEKIRHVLAIVQELPKDIRGFVNIADIRNQTPYFRYLT